MSNESNPVLFLVFNRRISISVRSRDNGEFPCIYHDHASQSMFHFNLRFNY